MNNAISSSVSISAESKIKEEVYPKALLDEEIKYVRQRHPSEDSDKAVDRPDWPSETLGLALSGGGIRSATFCLGFLQALAGKGLLGKIDFLSTVSGGGYIGSFLGALFVRRRSPNAVKEELGSPHSFPLGWLRENGRYLAPNGAGDLLRAIAIQFRNWCSVVLVMGVAGLAMFLSCNVIRGVLENAPWFGDFWEIHFPVPQNAEFWWWSPFFYLAAIVGVLGVIIGWAYWLIPQSRARWYFWPWVGSLGLLLACAVLHFFKILAPDTWYGEVNSAFGLAVVGTLVLWVGSWLWALLRIPRIPGFLFTTQDIASLPSLIAKLQDKSKISEYILGKFSVGVKDQVIKCKDSKPEGELKILLVKELNNILISGSSIYNTEAFEKVNLAPAMQQLLRTTHNRPTTWVNRLLLVEAFPQALKRKPLSRIRRPLSRIPEATYLHRNWLSAWLSRTLVLGAALVLFSLLDSVGQSLYLSWQEQGLGLSLKALLAASGLAPILSLGPKLLPFLTRKSASGRVGKIPVNALATIISFICLGLFLLMLNLLAHAIAWNWSNPKTLPHMNVALLAGACAATIVLSILMGRYFTFLHGSSLQLLYGSRLARAYLGASNEAREKQTNRAVTDMIPGDDIYLDRYEPHEFGGPLHLINLTFNETCSAMSNVEQRDRRGLQFALGPCGLSVGRTDHALWANSQDCKQPRGSQIRPIRPVQADQPTFEMFPPAKRGQKDKTADGNGTTSEEREVENISIGHWVALSGAAFGTGLGFRTRLGLSLLAGLANIRLGYWWDSHVKPSTRPPETKSRTPLVAKFGGWFAWGFPVQSFLLDEWFARFHGPARRYWYLSDGGHFENTGVYELLRRRVPYILCCDSGQDYQYGLDDVANLVRKARIDFNAEITFFSRPQLDRYREKGIPESIWKVLGTPQEFANATTRRHHAMLAEVCYDGEDNARTLILFVKPALSGDEPLDLREYQHTHPEFPHETTLDQFFDEAQWESYRKLGQHSGEGLCGKGPPEEWWFTKLDPTKFRAGESLDQSAIRLFCETCPWPHLVYRGGDSGAKAPSNISP